MSSALPSSVSISPPPGHVQLMYLLQLVGRKAILRASRQIGFSSLAQLTEIVAINAMRRALVQIPGLVSVSGKRQSVTPKLVAGWDSGWQQLGGVLRNSQIHIRAFSELPLWLQEIPDPPLGLYCQGNLQRLQQQGIAVIGARRCSSGGRRFAYNLGQRLARAGYTVNSGLALGIDGEAHRGALPWGNTIAVLGGGLQRVSPRSHAPLARNLITNGGLVISEYSPTSASYPAHFPERNRLLSGLSRAVVVVEAGLRSGSLITARLALEQGRDVLAVPGAVTNPTSAGCHRLVQQGAGLVTSAQDVADVLGLDFAADPERVPVPLETTSIEAKVFAALGAIAVGSPVTIDQLAHSLGSEMTAVGGRRCSVAEVSGALTRLELAGFVQRVRQGYIPSPE